MAGWDRTPLRRHCNFVIGMLVVGVLLSFALMLADEVQGAWAVLVVLSSSAAGAQWRLSSRLRDVSPHR